eukprot:scaffold3169_cov107-Cylindrotheca_fusiformis.AAC.8
MWSEPVGCGVEICGFGTDKTARREMREQNTAADSVDRILAADLERLSLAEREKVYEDVHGVSDATQETPELIASCLEQMDREIDLIQDRDAYEQAKLQSHNFVSNREFRLAFLRSTSFNPKMAASHLVNYFTHKLEVFGTENLAKRITLDDLDEATRRVLELGSMQVLPNRDSIGRAVFVSTPSFIEPAMAAYDDPIPMMAKAYWYLISTLMEDEETQKKGFIVVSNVTGLADRHEKCHRKLAMRLLALGTYQPLRLGCLHYYSSNANSLFGAMLLSVLASATRAVIRVRIRTHYGTFSTRKRPPYVPSDLTVLSLGSHNEFLYKLMSFGIPVQEFPFPQEGVVKLANHVKWLEKRRKKEFYLGRNPPIEGAVDLPSKHDVLLGRGKQIFRHPGNRLLHELVEAYFNQYDRLSKDGKTKLADQIVSIVQGYSGRFFKLDKESGMWVEVSSLEAREKVTHRFRHSRALGLKGGSTHSCESIASWTNKGTDGGGKRSRIMFSGF